MTVPDNDQSFLCTDATPAAMDQYWAEGWRHVSLRGKKLHLSVILNLDSPVIHINHNVPAHAVNTIGWFGWNDIAGALRTFGELIRDTPDEVRAGFRVEKDTGAVASCGYYGDPATAAAYHAKWKEDSATSKIPTIVWKVGATSDQPHNRPGRTGQSRTIKRRFV